MSSEEYETLSTREEDGVLWVALERPHRMNAINPEMTEEFSSVIEGIEEDKEIRCAVITGAGDNFSVGADVSAFKPDVMTMADATIKGKKEVIDAIEWSAKPYVVAIKGYCLGGGLELALACDFRIASEDAELGNPEINLGIIPGWGGTQRLPRIVGLANAKRIVMLGERMSAEDALEIGLIHEVVAKEELEEKTKKLAEKLRDGPPLALKNAKRVLNFGTQAPLAAGLRFETDSFATLFSTDDVIEGIEAFMEKRKPKFKGK